MPILTTATDIHYRRWFFCLTAGWFGLCPIRFFLTPSVSDRPHHPHYYRHGRHHYRHPHWSPSHTQARADFGDACASSLPVPFGGSPNEPPGEFPNYHVHFCYTFFSLLIFPFNLLPFLFFFDGCQHNIFFSIISTDHSRQCHRHEKYRNRNCNRSVSSVDPPHCKF